MSEWIDINEKKPDRTREILFIAKEGVTEERIGIAIPNAELVLLDVVDIKFSDLTHWIPIPEAPELRPSKSEESPTVS